MTITAEAAMARITEQTKQRNSMSVPFDTTRRSLRASKTELTNAVNELVAGGYVEYDTELGMLTMRGDDVFDVEPAQTALPLDEEEVDEVTEVVSYDDLPESPAVDEDYGDEDGDEEERVSKTIVPARYRAKYKATRNTCGDDLAYAITDFVNTTDYAPRKDGKGNKKIKMLSLLALSQLAMDNGIEPDAIKGNNNGQKRMNLSNMLRGMRRAGKDVVVAGEVFPGDKPTFTRADWLKATVDGYMAETGCTRPVAKAQAEQEWEVKTASGYEFDPATGELAHPDSE
jgi:hypothetical protein